MSRQQQQAELQELQREKAQLAAQIALQKHAAAYPVTLQWPAKIEATTTRTKDELLQHRLLEAGVLYDTPTTVGDTAVSIANFVQDLEKTGCFESIATEIGKGDEEGQHSLNVKLKEKSWYRVNVGGGLKSDGFFQPETVEGFLPTAELDASIGLRNLSGNLDKTEFSYTLDSRSLSTWRMSHERPLFTVLPEALSEVVLGETSGSRWSFLASACVDTLDFERTRSYKEYQRQLSARISNQHSIARAEQSTDAFVGLEWSLLLRDLVPRRHDKLPFSFLASPEVVSQTGPSLKHSISLEVRTNGSLSDDTWNPTQGLQGQALAELAIPPGTVGFAKTQGSLSLHQALSSKLSAHGMLNAGFLKSLDWGGICRPAGLSDRFHLGGPLQFRGFSPAGIGPRAGSGVASGDALGGSLFYSGTAMLSLLPTSSSKGGNPLDDWIESTGLRLFCFGSAGTCCDVASPSAILASSRLSAGVGIVTTAMGPRLEMTYSYPVRFSPRDIRQNFQFGFGFSFG